MIKKLKLLFSYIRILSRNKDTLKKEHNISIDWVWRMYKTYVIPIDELNNIKEYGYKYVDNQVKKEISKIDKTFWNIGLSEYVGIMDVVPLSEREIGLAFRFKYIDTAKLATRLIWLIIYLLGGAIGFLVYSYIGIGLGIFTTFIIYLMTRIFI